MSLTTYEMAKVLEQLDESPEKVMYGKLLTQLANQSEDRIRKAANQVPLDLLLDIIYQFQQTIESRKGEQVNMIAKDMKEQGFTAEELQAFLANK